MRSGRPEPTGVAKEQRALMEEPSLGEGTLVGPSRGGRGRDGRGEWSNAGSRGVTREGRQGGQTTAQGVRADNDTS